MQPEIKQPTFNTNEVNAFADRYKAITAQQLQTPAPVIPQSTQTNPYTGLSASSKAITSTLTPPTYTPPPEVNPATTYANTLSGIEAPNQANIQAELEKQAGIEQKTQTANALKSQIEAINAQEQAALRTLESQSGGKDVTSQFLGRQQQEISRQAAIQSLPLTAQYQAALGDLQGAQNTVTKLFTAKLADAQQKYDNAKEIAKIAYSYATDKEKAKIEAAQKIKDQEFEKEKLNIAAENERELARYKKQLEGTGATGENTQLYAGLSSPTATAVRSQVASFKTEPVITNFAVVQEGRNFANSIATDTKNPADDQALVYSLAKALDPNSVVREGEYATANKYSQSWIKAYGKGITQAIAGTGFLSKEARENIKKTIESKYQSSLRSYENLYGQYEKSINNLTGRTDGAKFIKDYQVSSPQTTTTPTAQVYEAQGVKYVQGADGLYYPETQTPTTTQTSTTTTPKKQTALSSMMSNIKIPSFNLFK